MCSGQRCPLSTYALSLLINISQVLEVALKPCVCCFSYSSSPLLLLFQFSINLPPKYNMAAVCSRYLFSFFSVSWRVSVFEFDVLFLLSIKFVFFTFRLLQ